jgi:hypothetical protein
MENECMPFKNFSELIDWELSQNRKPNTSVSGEEDAGHKLRNCRLRKLKYISSKTPIEYSQPFV